MGATALTLAAFHGRLATVTQILDASAQEGAVEALLTWATHRGETPMMVGLNKLNPVDPY